MGIINAVIEIMTSNSFLTAFNSSVITEAYTRKAVPWFTCDESESDRSSFCVSIELSSYFRIILSNFCIWKSKMNWLLITWIKKQIFTLHEKYIYKSGSSSILFFRSTRDPFSLVNQLQLLASTLDWWMISPCHVPITVPDIQTGVHQ